MIRVGVVGATGKMGREVCRAVHDDPELELVAAVTRSSAGRPLAELLGLAGCEVVAAGPPRGAAARRRAEVAVDFTGPSFAREHVEWCIEHGVHAVVGTTGFEIDPAWGGQRERGGPRGAELRGRRGPDDAVRRGGRSGAPRRRDRRAASAQPSSMRRAARRRRRPGASRPHAAGIGDDVPIHSVRLPGLVAHQEVVFGATGSDAHDPTRHQRPFVVHAGSPAGREGGSRAPGIDRRDRRALGGGVTPRGSSSRCLAVVVAHPDDDTFGCAGSVALHADDPRLPIRADPRNQR